MCCTKSYISDSIVAKALVAWTVVRFSRNLGLQYVVLKGDGVGNSTCFEEKTTKLGSVIDS